MKKILCLLTVISFFSTLSAQQITDSTGLLDINQVKAFIGSGGLNFYDFSTYHAGFEYPKYSGKKTIYTSTLWVGGKSDNILYLAGEKYRGEGRDYNPGPVIDNAYYNTEIPNWNRVWKINKTEIDYHIQHWSDPGYIVPSSIQSWPAHGDTTHGMNYSQAPFEDVNNDYVYNPMLGDYPKIRGEQAIYFIFNDSAFQHEESNGKILGIEVHGMAFAYNSNPYLQNVIFVNYLIYNRSLRTYDSLYIGNFVDFDLGSPYDDYIGCDSSLKTFYAYNGNQNDGVYGSNPPVQAATLLSLPMTGFAYFNNVGGTISAMTDPYLPEHYYGYMRGYWIDNQPFVYGGNGYPDGPEDTIVCHYIFPGYPNDSLQWNEVNAGNTPYDRRGLGVTGPYTLAPGGYLSFDMSYTTVDTTLAKSDGFPNVDNMLMTIPFVQHAFDSLFPDDGHDIALGIENQPTSTDGLMNFRLYPNPVKEILTFRSDLFDEDYNIQILDLQGRILLHSVCKGNNATFNVSHLGKGIYFFRIFNPTSNQVLRFLKL